MSQISPKKSDVKRPADKGISSQLKFELKKYFASITDFSTQKLWANPRLVVGAFVLAVLLLILMITISLSLLELLVVLVILLLVMLGLGWLTTWRVSQRINQFIDAAEHIAQGDLTVRVADAYPDEIGRLGQAFNQMVINLDELQKSRNLLSRTMSPAVRHSLIEHGLDFRGLTQTVSILFIDIRDFTRITENHNTEQLVFFLNDYYTTIAKQVHIEGGIIGKYAGDSILAFFGAPEPKSAVETSVAALLTALALQEAIDGLSERWMILGMPPIRIGIGITIGPVVAGPIGSTEQFEYTVIGDVVNLASRLQNLTRNVAGFDIILSAEVYEALDSMFKNQIQIIDLEQFQQLNEQEKAKRPVQFVDLGEVLVKGKKGPVRVYGFPDLANRQVPMSSSLPHPPQKSREGQHQ